MVKSSRSYSRSSISAGSNSDLVRCAGQIKAMGFSLFLIVIIMIIFSTIPLSEFKKLNVSMLSNKPPAGQENEVPPIPAAVNLLPETINKFFAIIALSFIAVIIFISSIIIATGKGCYKTSLFGILFGLLFGIF